jgi:hypothetical protein
MIQTTPSTTLNTKHSKDIEQVHNFVIESCTGTIDIRSGIRVLSAVVFACCSRANPISAIAGISVAILTDEASEEFHCDVAVTPLVGSLFYFHSSCQLSLWHEETYRSLQF